jgi:hypothetical protein
MQRLQQSTGQSFKSIIESNQILFQIAALHELQSTQEETRKAGERLGVYTAKNGILEARRCDWL